MKTIFIVDDNRTNLTAAKNALDSTYQTFTMTSAERMFKLLETIVPDLILLDLKMPEMGGFEALPVLKADSKLKKIPVILLTASGDASSEAHGFELGAADYIIKPFLPQVLIERIQKHL